jgi:hypothetical protein
VDYEARFRKQRGAIDPKIFTVGGRIVLQ